jgi:hypothetical protein
MLRKTLTCLSLIAVLATGAYAVDPATSPPDETEPVRSARDQEMLDASQGKTGTSMPFPRQFVMGKVADATGAGMPGVTVKLFADGELVESDRANSSGEFELDLPLNMETDETVVLWFVPGTDQYLMKCIVLKKSAVASQMGMFGRCANEVEMQAQMRVDTSLLTEDQLVEFIKARGCY